jgi:hypothetical protein
MPDNEQQSSGLAMTSPSDIEAMVDAERCAEVIAHLLGTRI